MAIYEKKAMAGASRATCRLRLNIWRIFVFSIFLGSWDVSARSSDKFSNGNAGTLFPSYTAEKTLDERNLSMELESTLERVPYITKARVHLSLAPSGLWKDSSQHSGASVVILSEVPEKINRAEIQELVAGASAALEKVDVHVFTYPLAKSSRTKGVKQSIQEQSGGRFGESRGLLIGVLLVVLICASSLTTVGIQRRLARRKRALSTPSQPGSLDNVK